MRTSYLLVAALSSLAIHVGTARAAGLSMDDAQALAIAAGGYVGCGGDERAATDAVERAAKDVDAEGPKSMVRTTLSFLYGGAKTMTTVEPAKCTDARAAYDKAVTTSK